MQEFSRVVSVSVVVVAIAMLVVGCGGTQPKPTEVTPQQVQADSDRFFDHLGQEEASHGGGRETSKP